MTSESLPVAADALEAEVATGPVPAWLQLAASFLATVLMAILLAAAVLVGIQAAYTGRVMPGVRVAGVDVSGLDRAAAESRLRAALPSLAAGHVALVLGDQRSELGYAAVGRDYDLQGVLDTAFSVGRRGDALQRSLDELYGLARGTSLVVGARWDRAAAAKAVETAAAAFDRAPVDASLVRTAVDSFVVIPARWGRQVDRGAAAAAVDAILGDVSAPAPTTVSLEVRPVTPTISTAQADLAQYRARLMTAQDLTLVEGADRWTIPAASLPSWVQFRPGAAEGRLEVAVGGQDAEAALKALADKVAREPKDATFLTGDGGRIVGVLPGVDGRVLDVPKTMENIAAGLAAQGEASKPPTARVAVTLVKPTLPTEEAQKVAPLMERISTWTTYYPVSERNFFGNNITIPARIIDGTVVAPGEWFSFWKTVGTPTSAQGYGPGGAIINGRSDPTGAFAGGICSASTTLFNTAARAGLQLGERQNHYYYINRYPLGLDATVWMNSGGSGQDVTWRNDTAYPVLIRGVASPGVVRFDFYSVPTRRTVTFSTPIVKNYLKAWDTSVQTTAIPPGTAKRLEYPTDGMDVWVTRTVRDSAGNVIHQETFYSHYARVIGVLWVGVAAPAPTPAPTP